MAEELATRVERPSTHGDHALSMMDQKTRLVGQMAGAMANQFNNLMMAITSAAEVELRRAAPSQQRNLEQILKNTARASSLIQRLLAFSRKHIPLPRKLLLNPVVEEIGDFLQPLMGDEISVSLKLDPLAGSVEADPIEIEQILLTLCLTARENMARGGTMHVSTEQVTLDAKPAEADEAELSGSCAMLYVHCAQTPGPARPSLGPFGGQDLRMTQAMASVRSLVRQRHGQLRVSKRPGHSTTFRVFFPIARAESVAARKGAAANTAPSTKTILIVEDDDAVRNPAAEFLKMEGFKVLQARTGPEALRIVQESRSHLDLLVTDIVMAGMHGNKVAEELSKTHPALKVLFMTGDTHAVAGNGNGKLPADNMLQKPFRLNKLMEKIHQLLGE